jgi:hypothetical protein
MFWWYTRNGCNLRFRTILFNEQCRLCLFCQKLYCNPYYFSSACRKGELLLTEFNVATEDRLLGLCKQKSDTLRRKTSVRSGVKVHLHCRFCAILCCYWKNCVSFLFQKKICRSDGCTWISFLETNHTADMKLTAINYNHLSQYRLRNWLAPC